MKLLSIIAVALIGLVVLSIAHPYINGVAYTHQRECERNALLIIAYKISEQRHGDHNASNAVTLRQIVSDALISTVIDDSRFEFPMRWDILDRDEYQIGDVDKTILLFPDATPSTIGDSKTPLIAHVSSSFITENTNCVLLVLATPEIPVLNLANSELEQLIGCATPQTPRNGSGRIVPKTDTQHGITIRCTRSRNV